MYVRVYVCVCVMSMRKGNWMVMCDGSAINIKFSNDKTNKALPIRNNNLKFRFSIHNSHTYISWDTRAPKNVGLNVCDTKSTYVTIRARSEFHKCQNNGCIHFGLKSSSWEFHHRKQKPNRRQKQKLHHPSNPPNPTKHKWKCSKAGCCWYNETVKDF